MIGGGLKEEPFLGRRIFINKILSIINDGKFIWPRTLLDIDEIILNYLSRSNGAGLTTSSK
jgi:hypothetical protein